MDSILHCKSCRQYKIGACLKKPNDPICKDYVPDIAPKLAPSKNDISDMVHHPNHYCQGGIECIKAIEASMDSEGFQDYCKGNVLKYIWRWRDKAGVQDLEKAKVYLDWLIESAKKDLEADTKECL